nr:DNA helicase [Tanacetum cinerariifolium]
MRRNHENEFANAGLNEFQKQRRNILNHVETLGTFDGLDNVLGGSGPGCYVPFAGASLESASKLLELYLDVYRKYSQVSGKVPCVQQDTGVRGSSPFIGGVRDSFDKRKLQPIGHSDAFGAYLALYLSGVGSRRSRSLSQIMPVLKSNLVHADCDSQNSSPVSRLGGNTRENSQLQQVNEIVIPGYMVFFVFLFFTSSELRNVQLRSRMTSKVFVRSTSRRNDRRVLTSDGTVDTNSVASAGTSYTYSDLGDCDCRCRYCGAFFWYVERLKGHSHNRTLEYNLCCRGGRLQMQRLREPPKYIKSLFANKHFMENIRAYNQMFAMMSFEAKVDESINAGQGSYVFKVSDQIYHWIGSLCPPAGERPRFLQLYIYDTDNEVQNRMDHFGGIDNSQIEPVIVEGLIHFLDAHNELVQLFQTTRDKCRELEILAFKIRLYNAEGARAYERPTTNTLGAMVFKNGVSDNADFDVIIQHRNGLPKGVNKLHCSYMSLQFPLLFIYGQAGDYLSGMYDAISRGEREGYEVGGRIILPMSFIGGPRYMYAHYLDALAICRKLGNLQFFITFTCNVFEQKIQALIAFLKEERIFGDVTKASRIKITKDVDRFVLAELPDPRTDPEGYNIVSKLMMHGPCGAASFKAPCMKDRKCSKKFLKKFNQNTFDENGHVHYRRRDTCVSVTRNEFQLDNSYVFPYNRDLLLAFRAHINVEYCGWSMLIEYLFKYISKGIDRVFVRVSRSIGESSTSATPSRQVIDKIQNYVEGRFICAHEAYWRILKFDIHRREPAVQILAVHLEDMQRITFRDEDRLESVTDFPGRKSTTLTEWFAFYEANEVRRHLSYLDFPSEFVWGVTKTIICSLRSERKIVLAVASSGIASLLLPSGRIAHSRFKLPLEQTEESLYRITKNTQLGKLLADTDLIIWDEAPMNDRRCFEALDRSLRDIVDRPSSLFDGKSVLLGGDFRQTLPVKKGASKIEITSSCISESTLWPSFKVFMLKHNMSLARPDINLEEQSLVNSFASWLLDVGDEKIGEPADEDPENTSWVHVPHAYCLPSDEQGLSKFIDFICEQITLHSPSAASLQQKAIVCPKNETANIINSKVLDMVAGESTIYISQDEATPTRNDGSETEMIYLIEHLNTFKLIGFPPHQLELKVGAPFMLLRNVNIVGGLCNGTRMIVRQLMTKLIETTLDALDQLALLAILEIQIQDKALGGKSKLKTSRQHLQLRNKRPFSVNNSCQSITQRINLPCQPDVIKLGSLTVVDKLGFPIRRVNSTTKLITYCAKIAPAGLNLQEEKNNGLDVLFQMLVTNVLLIQSIASLWENMWLIPLLKTMSRTLKGCGSCTLLNTKDLLEVSRKGYRSFAVYAMDVSRKGYLEDTAGSKLDEMLFQELWFPSRWHC